MKCEHCLQKGHVKKTCYKLIGSPENFKGKKRVNLDTHPLARLNLGYMSLKLKSVGPTPAFTQNQYNQIVQMLSKYSIGDATANMEGNSNYAINTASANSAGILSSHNDDSVKSVVDTRATNYMIGDKVVFQTSTLVDDTGKVQLPTGESANISDIGNCQLLGDDLLIIGSDMRLIQETKNILQTNFKIKDLGELIFFLSIEFARSNEGILMHQRKYALELISDFGARRTDISFAIQNLSQFMHSPKQSHMEATTRVVKYIKQALRVGILMSSTVSSKLHAYCDVDWGSCLTTIKSVSGYAVKICDSLWKSKK
uniref:Reverse transcriptase Ty1/copia-type domain-containing protein n=1 Tax=Solanum lycopersicum TaxID=4081 RepID=A0A3Q7ITK6_SOLLC